WDLVSDRELYRFREEKGHVWNAGTSSDARYFASATGFITDLRLGFWELPIGPAKGHLPARPPVDLDPPQVLVPGVHTALALSPDSSLLATGDRQTVSLWQTTGQKGKCRRDGHEGEISCMAFSLDGRTLASADDSGMIRLWETAVGQEAGVLRG